MQSKVNILAVDDREENLLALEAVLMPADYNLVKAYSGEEALRYLLNDDFAVILLDVQMPGLNGFETAKLIKSRPKSAHIPIILITAISQANEHVLQGYQAGAVDYIFKPFNPQALKFKVDTFVKIKQDNKKLEQLVEDRTKDLQRSQELFKKIFEASPSLIAIRSLKDNRYIDVNTSWLNYTGYSYKDVKNNTSDLLKFKEIPELEFKIPIYNEKVGYLTKSGEKRSGLLSTEKVEINEEPCVLTVITDITERIIMEKEIAKFDRLNLVGEMAAGIAHEIRNPMTTVRGFLQMAGSGEVVLAKEHTDLMIEELDRANEIISEYLTLAKNRNTVKELHRLNDIIETIAPLIQAEAYLSDKTVELNLLECPPLLLDEKEIRQLILNLAINGLEAMPEGKKLTLRTYQKGERVVMEVGDEGCGIEQSILDHLGTPFMTTKEKGTGLGLAVCYSVAARHNASIKVKTSKQGTIFRVSFKIG